MGVQGSGVWGLGFKVYVWGIGVFSIGSFPGHHTAGYLGIFGLILTEDLLPYPRESPSRHYGFFYRGGLGLSLRGFFNKFLCSSLWGKGSGKAERGIFSRGGSCLSGAA